MDYNYLRTCTSQKLVAKKKFFSFQLSLVTIVGKLYADALLGKTSFLGVQVYQTDLPVKSVESILSNPEVKGEWASSPGGLECLCCIG